MTGDTDMTDLEIARWREAFAALSEDAVPTPACPPAGRLWEAARGELAPGALREVIDHTAACAACAEAWRLTREIDAAPSPAVGEPARRERAPWWASARGGLLAAAAVLALVVGWQGLDLLRPAQDVTFRGASPSGQAVRSLVADRLPRADFVLRWEGPEGARYDLLVFAEDLAPLAEVEDLEESFYRVPEQALAGLAPGERVRWQVEATVDGVASPPALFEVGVE